MIVLGGGYDTRGVKLLLEDKVDRVFELDLPAVVTSKRTLLERAVGKSKFVSMMEDGTLNLEAVDLNDEQAFERVMDRIVASFEEQKPTKKSWYTLVVSEALLLYLDTGVPGKILQSISERFNDGGASFLFADRLELQDDKGVEETAASTTVESQVQNWLARHGWKLQEFKSKVGATRHLGIATAIK